ncbi:ribosome silencing factor [Nocardioides jiangxiensis]|uniref:Ribosomal silencing factor RsfS n=1 Tax=Nocardioides jiangxiensis TaxID=3064524 RepID=A0ABT9AXJ4_9ACTN|nr:ribosome silencing factor [Nocardioides sp. WY-20]MDO7867267.1 ribosome silencing factor [Nocardioides sp. WY-20]
MTAHEESVRLITIAARAAADKKATEIRAYDVSEQVGITDAYLLATGNNEPQVKAIVEEIEDKLREDSALKPIRREGDKEGLWVLLDFGDIVIHVQRQEEREYYALERLWRDSPLIELPKDLHGPADA